MCCSPYSLSSYLSLYSKKSQICTFDTESLKKIYTVKPNIVIITVVISTTTNADCQFDEKVDHITTACRVLEKEQYIKSQDKVCAQTHFKLCKESGLKLEDKHRYELVQKSVNKS